MSSPRSRMLCHRFLLAGVLLSCAALSAGATKPPPAGKSVVAIAKGSDVSTIVRQAVELAGGIKGIVKPGSTVIVKPNVVVACKPGNGEITDPAVVREVIKLVREAGASEVIIAEASGGASTTRAYIASGYDDLAKEMKVKLVDLNWDEVRTVKLPEGLAMKDYFIPRTVMDADVLIDVPVMKTHNQGVISCAMKNWVGVAPGVMYGWHKGLSIPHDKRLPEVITDLHSVRKPDFCVVDGTVALAGTGPRAMDGGFPFRMDVVIAGEDPVAVDTVCAQVMGIAPREVRYLQLAQDKGLGHTDMEKISVKGMDIAQVKRDFRGMDRVEAARSLGDLMGEIIGTRVARGQVAICWLGQGGFAFKTSRNLVLVVDPYLSDSVGVKRLQPIPIPPEKIQADVVLVTHDHLDHTDPGTLPGIAGARNPRFVGPPSSCEHMKKLGIAEERLVEITRGKTELVNDVKISAVYAKHTDDSVGYVIDCFGLKVYITGDSEYDVQLLAAKALSPDVLIVCINGKLGNMDIAQAVELTKQIGPQIVIPMHYGMFADNTADPQEFVRQAKSAGITAEAVVLSHGKVYTCPAE